MKKYFWIVLFPFAVQAQSLSLSQIKEKARHYNPQTDILPLIDQATENQIKVLRAGNLPQTNLNGQATYQSTVTSLPIKLPNITITPVPKDQYRVTLDVVQNIWDGGMIKQQKNLAVSNGIAEQKKITSDLQQVDEQINNLYFGAMLADKQMLSSEIVHKDLMAKIEIIKSAISNGISIKNNLLNLQAKNLEVEQQLHDISNRKASAIEGLSLLIGEKIDPNIHFEAELPPSVDINQNNRAELAYMDAQKDVLNTSEKISKAKNLPKLMAFATGGYGRPGLNMLSSDFQTYFIGGVQLKVPLSHLYTKSQSAEIQQLKINQMKLDKQKQNFLLATSLRVQSLQNDLENLKELLKTDKELIDIREQIRKTAESQLTNGIISSADYITELTNLDLARQTMNLHEIQLYQTQQNLRLILGQ